MEQLFVKLSHAVAGAPAVALAASFVWGILSIILSPCHLSSIPLIVGFISGQGRMSAARASGIATLFAAGILLTIAAIGLITAARWPHDGRCRALGRLRRGACLLCCRPSSVGSDSHAVVGPRPSGREAQRTAGRLSARTHLSALPLGLAPSPTWRQSLE